MNSENKPKPSQISALIAVGRELLRKIFRPIYRPTRRFVRFVLWALPSMGNLLSQSSANDRRVLAVYDTSSQPFSIGDLLIFQEASLVLCEKYNTEIVDFVILFDPAKPASSDPVFAASFTEDNVLFHLASLLPLAQVNQKLGSVFIFNSHEHLERYIVDNTDRYYVWPSGWKVGIREYLSPVIFNELLYNHYKAHDSIPHLICRPFLKDWAEAFYREHVHAQVPVTINIRNNKAWHLHRNSQLDSWIELFRYCESRYSAKFIVICARSEIDDRLREIPNVIIAKDFHTGVEQDMALIHTSAMHMGAGSGPATMAWFNSKPYLMVNTEYKIGEFFEHVDMIQRSDMDTQKFWFAGPNQRIAKGAESPELLIKEFALLWDSVNQEYWRNVTVPQNSTGAKLHTWLR